jgi:hypothetical protein
MQSSSGSAAYRTSAVALNASLEMGHRPLVDACFGAWASFEVLVTVVSCGVHHLWLQRMIRGPQNKK